MKKFLSTLLAVIIGVLVVNIIGFFLLIGFFSALADPNSSTEPIPVSGVLKIDMSKIQITEAPNPDDAFSTMYQQGVAPVSLWQAVQALNIAATDPAVKYLYLKPDGASLGTGAMQEFRKALANFRANGKAIVAYTESPTTGSYYLASVSDRVYLSSYKGATYTFTGLSGRMMFIKDLLDAIGIKVQLIRHGKYKSAGEMYIRNTPSKENLEQQTEMINSIWSSYSADIAASRGITVAKLNAALDNLKLCEPQDFLDEGLVDALMDRSEMKAKLALLAMAPDYDHVAFIKFADYVKDRVKPNIRARKKIAVVYVDGQIVDGSALQEVAGDRFAAILEDVRADSLVKAVVLRVNSPGGSVVASEKIKREVDLLREVKPVVASYGNYAASGGYWISNSCDKIYSDEATLTGSIGVFGMIPDFSGVLHDKAHVNIVPVNSNKHGDMMQLTRPLDDDEYAYIRKSIEGIYSRFVSIVADGRSLEESYVDNIAQGRVWTGSDALGIGLVDEIGTLEDAILWTAALAGDASLGSWNIAEYPQPIDPVTAIINSINGTDDADFSVRALVAGLAARRAGGSFASAFVDVSTQPAMQTWYNAWQLGNADFAFARLPFDLEIR